MTARTDMLERLEACVDRASLPVVLELLAIVCEEKAEHLRANWQDATTAERWEATGRELDRHAARVKARGL